MVVDRGWVLDLFVLIPQLRRLIQDRVAPNPLLSAQASTIKRYALLLAAPFALSHQVEPLVGLVMHLDISFQHLVQGILYASIALPLAGAFLPFWLNAPMRRYEKCESQQFRQETESILRSQCGVEGCRPVQHKGTKRA